MNTLEQIIANANKLVHYPAYGSFDSDSPACLTDIQVKDGQLALGNRQITCEVCQDILALG